MRVAVFGTKPYDRRFLTAANDAAGGPHELTFFEAPLDASAARLAAGFRGVCAFVNDRLDGATLRTLAAGGTSAVALRSAGFDHVDLAAADALGIAVARVPAYSPEAVAEHAAALALTLNRKVHRAFNRVREGNFALEGLLGFNLRGKTVGIVGTGKIGAAAARIFAGGFGCRVVAHDKFPSRDVEATGVRYVELPELFRESDVVSLHCPLTPETRHLIHEETIAAMKPGVMIINTSRGGLIDTRAAIEGLKSGRIGYLGLDVYEGEADLFFEDRSGEPIGDDAFARLLTLPNVIVTGHQAFFTREALQTIAEVTIDNLARIERGEPCENLVRG